MVKKYHTEEERLEAQRQSVKKYQQSDKFKAAQKKYFSSEKGKAAIKRYFKSERGKKSIQKYQSSEKFRDYIKKYQQTDKGKDVVRKSQKKYQQSDKFKVAQKKYQQSDKFKTAKNKYKQSEKGKNTVNSWRRNKLKTDPFYRIRNSLGARIGQYLRQRNSKKISSLTKLIGCSKDQLIKHLESKFYTNKETNEPMTWDNYGRGGWEVDHKMPIDSFKDQDITSLETQKKIMHYTNLQPMWGNENKAKSNKILND